MPCFMLRCTRCPSPPLLRGLGEVAVHLTEPWGGSVDTGAQSGRRAWLLTLGSTAVGCVPLDKAPNLSVF